MRVTTKPTPHCTIRAQKSLWMRPLAWLVARHVKAKMKRSRRRASTELAKLPDWQLRDIGISPAQIEQARKNR